MRKFQRWIIVCAVLAGSVVMAAVTKGPYLIYTGNPSTMTVLWQTDATQSGTLYWGTSTSYSSGNMSSTEISSSSHQHKKTITGLSPATRYYYKIVVGSTTLTGNFKSAPSSSETDIKFLVYGDTRSNPGDHNTVASRIVDVYTADSAYQTMLLHVGDLANDGNSESSWTRDFFPRNQSSILKMQSSLPIQATMGNHEGTGTLFKKYFPYPFVGDRYWSFDYGPVHVSVVDQYVGDGNDVTGLILNTAQKNWLINDLSTTTKKFKIILLHHPGWAARGGHDNNNFVMNTLHPIFKQYGVTAVFGGHNHYYARAVNEGVHYVTTGGGGAPLRDPVKGQPKVVAGTELKALQLCKVKIIGDVFTCSSIKASDGSVIDTFSVTKSSGGGKTLPVVSFSAPANLNVQPGTNLYVNVSATDPDGIDRVYLYKNGVELARSEGGAPYEWNAAGQSDAELKNLQTGSFTLTARAVDMVGDYSEKTVTVVVGTPATLPSIGSIITLKAVNGKYVSATYSTNNVLIADKTAVSNYERFKVIDASGSVALQCMGNSKYVSINATNGTKPMLASRTTIGSFEKFNLVQSGTNMAIQSALTMNYASAVSNGAAPLQAIQTYIGGYEKFTWKVE